MDPVTVPVRKLPKGQFTSLRQGMISLTHEGEYIGGVDTGAGLGDDAIWIRWKGEYYSVRGRDLLLEVVKQIDPEEAERLKESM